MAKKADFTEQEWESLQKGVVGAGLLVSLSDRSFFDTFKEAGALGKHVAQAKQGSSSDLVRDLADLHGTGFGLTSSHDKVENEAWRRGPQRRRRVGPDDRSRTGSSSSRCQSVADAAGGGDAAESGAIEKVRSAVG